MKIFYHKNLYIDGLCCDFSNTAVPGADSSSSLELGRKSLFRLLGPALGSPAALGSLSLRLIKMMCRDPALIIRCRARGHRRSIGSHDGNLVSGVDFLRLARRLLSTLAAFPSATLLWEERADPGAVNEVACASKGSTEKEVEKYAARLQRRTISRD